MINEFKDFFINWYEISNGLLPLGLIVCIGIFLEVLLDFKKCKKQRVRYIFDLSSYYTIFGVVVVGLLGIDGSYIAMFLFGLMIVGQISSLYNKYNNLKDINSDKVIDISIKTLMEDMDFISHRYKTLILEQKIDLLLLEIKIESKVEYDGYILISNVNEKKRTIALSLKDRDNIIIKQREFSY